MIQGTTNEATLTCPDCGSSMVLRLTSRFTYRDGSARPFYSCSTYPACRSTHGAHPDGRPMGIPGDAATKAARMRAHDALDALWKGKTRRMNRRQAYSVVRRLMGMTEEQAHLGRFSAEECERLIALLGEARHRREVP